MKKGFTLVEIIGVVVLLGVIAAITVITINGTLNNSKEKLYNTQIENIIKGARIWASTNVLKLPEAEGEYVIVNLGQLKETGLIDKDITNPKTQEKFKNDLEIKITLVNKDYSYDIIE